MLSVIRVAMPSNRTPIRNKEHMAAIHSLSQSNGNLIAASLFIPYGGLILRRMSNVASVETEDGCFIRRRLIQQCVYYFIVAACLMFIY